MRRLAILFALAAAAFGQSPSQFPSPYNPLAWRYYATYSGTALTVQQPAANNAQVHFEQAVIECAAAETVTLSWNGAAATSTTLAIVKSPQTQRLPAATAWSASNVGTGTVGPVYGATAAATLLIDLSLFTMGNGGTGVNFTIKTAGTCNITIQWREDQP
jgi:hypothetical protein